MDKYKELHLEMTIITKHCRAGFETHCTEFPNQFSGFSNRVAFSYGTSLHLEAMELAGHTSKHEFQPYKNQKILRLSSSLVQ